MGQWHSPKYMKVRMRAKSSELTPGMTTVGFWNRTNTRSRKPSAKYCQGLSECTYGAWGLLEVFFEEFRAGGEHEFVRGELAVLHGDGDVGVLAELRRNKGGDAE